MWYQLNVTDLSIPVFCMSPQLALGSSILAGKLFLKMEHCVYAVMQKYSGCEARSSTASGIALTRLSDPLRSSVY